MTQGWSRSQVVRDILSGTAYQGQLVQGYYKEYLGRQPSSSEVSYWVNLLQSGWTDEQVQAGLLSSTEYWNRQGQNLSNYVKAVYEQVWGRDPQAWEVNAQTYYLTHGESLQAFTTGMLANAEYWQTLVNQSSSTPLALGYVPPPDYYETYLRRVASSSEVSTWVTTQQQQNLRDEDILAGIVGSDEYFSRIANW